jgi:hypothetical protein
MEFLRAGQAVNFGAPEKYFWLAEAPFPIFISTLQRYEIFSNSPNNFRIIFVKHC